MSKILFRYVSGGSGNDVNEEMKFLVLFGIELMSNKFCEFCGYCIVLYVWRIYC